MVVEDTIASDSNSIHAGILGGIGVNVEVTIDGLHQSSCRGIVGAVSDRTGSTVAGIGLTSGSVGVIGDFGDVDLAGGAIHIGDVRLSDAGTISSVTSPPDGVDDAVAGSSSDVNSTDQVAVRVEEPSVLGGFLTSLIKPELGSIVIDSAFDIVLLAVPIDDGLSTLDGSSLTNNVAGLGGSGGGDSTALSSRVTNNSGESVQQNIIADSILIVGLAVGKSISGLSSGLELSGRIDRTSLIDLERDSGRGLQVILSVIGSRGNIGDLGKEGVDHDDGVIIDLDQTALSAHLGGGVGQVDRVLGSDLLTVNIQGVSGVSSQAGVVSDIALSNSLGVGSDRSSLNSSIGHKSGTGLAVGPLVEGTAPLIGAGIGLGQAEVLVTEGVVLGVAEDGAVAVVAERRSVGDGRDVSSGAEQELGDQLTGSRRVEVLVLDVLQNAELLGVLRNVELPVSAGELTVLVVADSAQDHGESLIAGDLVGRAEGLGVVALDQTGVGAVANVAGGPLSAVHVGELVVGSVQGGLSVLDVARVETVDDRGDLRAGDSALRLEGAIGVALEDLHARENVNSFAVSLIDLVGILEGCVGTDDGQRQSHDQRQNQCE